MNSSLRWAVVLCLAAEVLLRPSHLPAAEPERMVVRELVPQDYSVGKANMLTQLMIAQLQSTGKFRIYSREEIQQVLEQAGTAQQLGTTSDTTKYMLDFGAAMNADRVVSGSIGLIGSKYVVTLSLYNITKGERESVVTRTCSCSEDELVTAVPGYAMELLGLEIPVKRKTKSEEDAERKVAAAARARPVNSEITLMSYNYPTHAIRHRNSLGELSEMQSDLDRKDATFKMVKGLADPSAFSFESVNYPGYYLRHQEARLKLHKNDKSKLFLEDATFRIVPGLADDSLSSFVPYNYPGFYIRHKNSRLSMESGDDELFRKDATFKISEPAWRK